MIDKVPATHRSEAAVWSVRGLGFALGATLVVGAVVGMILAMHVAIVVFISVLLGSAIEPLVARGRDRLPIQRGVVILGIYALVVTTVVIAVLVFLPGALAEAEDVAARLPGALAALESWAKELRPEVIGTMVLSLTDAAQAALLQARPPRADEVVGVGVTVAGAAVTMVTIFALVYFWITERARLQRYATAFLPFDRRAGAREAWNEIELRLGGWVRGQLVLMGTVAAATGAAYWLLGLPSAIVLGIIAGLTELIPLIGPALGVIPALFVAAAMRPDLIVPIIIVYLVIQVVEGNVLVPVVMRNSVGISPFVIIVSLLIGGAIGGLIGALIAIPVAAVVVVILDQLQARDVPVTLETTAATADDDELEADDPIDGSGRRPVVVPGR